MCNVATESECNYWTQDSVIQPSAHCDPIKEFIILSYLTCISSKKGCQRAVSFPAKIIYPCYKNEHLCQTAYMDVKYIKESKKYC